MSDTSRRARPLERDRRSRLWPRIPSAGAASRTVRSPGLVRTGRGRTGPCPAGPAGGSRVAATGVGSILRARPWKSVRPRSGPHEGRGNGKIHRHAISRMRQLLTRCADASPARLHRSLFTKIECKFAGANRLATRPEAAFLSRQVLSSRLAWTLRPIAVRLEDRTMHLRRIPTVVASALVWAFVAGLPSASVAAAPPQVGADARPTFGRGASDLRRRRRRAQGRYGPITGESWPNGCARAPGGSALATPEVLTKQLETASFEMVGVVWDAGVDPCRRGRSGPRPRAPRVDRLARARAGRRWPGPTESRGATSGWPGRDRASLRR